MSILRLFHRPAVDWTGFVWEGGIWHPKRYQQYSASVEHDVVQDYIFQLYDHQCCDCGGEAEVLHHTHEGYRHLGKELPGRHAFPLCNNCHAKRHGKLQEAAAA